MGDAIKFKYRTAGIALWGEKVLIYRDTANPYWSLGGGKIELGELSRDALRREIIEETGYDVVIGPLVWLSEHIFKRESNGHVVHEVVYYYRMTFPEGSGIYRDGDIPGDESGRKLIFKWVEVDCLDELTLYPTFLSEKLTKLDDGFVHLVDDMTGGE